jgi:hypothetical protein
MSARSRATKEAIQALFARAAARRAERRVFLQTLRTILKSGIDEHWELLLRPERRLRPRDA